jgi:endonuclease/exonuclease/phosphatase family metal-dependent hydrolase
VCSSVKLRDKITGRVFHVLNSHLDDRSDEQRRLGAALMLHRARFEAQIRQHTVLILGDFNSPQSGRDSGAYRIVTGHLSSPSLPARFLSAFPVSDDAPAFKMVDVKAETPRQFVSGHYATYTG